MKKTLAVFLTVLLVLSLAPSVFAGSWTANMLEADDGSDTTKDNIFTQADTLEPGRYVIAGETGYDHKYNAMTPNEKTSVMAKHTGLDCKEVVANVNDANVDFLTNPDNSIIWEAEYSEGDGFTFKNLGTNKFLYVKVDQETEAHTLVTNDVPSSWDWGPDDRGETIATYENVLKLYNDDDSDQTVLSYSFSGPIFFMDAVGPSGGVKYYLFKLEGYEPAGPTPEKTETPTNPPLPIYDEVEGDFYAEELSADTVLNPGEVVIIATSSNRAMTFTGSKAAKLKGLLGMEITPSLEGSKSALHYIDPSVCWYVERYGDPGYYCYKFKNMVTGEYLAGSKNNTTEGLHTEALETAPCSVWYIREPIANGGYTLKADGIANAYSHISYNAADGQFELNNNMRGIDILFYRVDGTSPSFVPPTEVPSNQPATQAPVSEIPASEVPASEVPASNNPASEAPESNQPVTDVPITSAPVSEDPVSDAPVSTDPASEAPVTTELAADTFTVTFADWDGTVLDTQEVPAGGAATEPESPTRENWIFTGWDNEFTNITADITVTAQYTKLGDMNDDDDVNAADATLVLRSLVGSIKLTKEQELFADTNGNGAVDAADATVILRHAVGAVVIDYGEEK